MNFTTSQGKAIFGMSDSIHDQSAAIKQSANKQIVEFHKRAGESHAEARKLVTGMAVGSIGVLYATLTGKDAPALDSCNKSLAILAIFAMLSSTIFGLIVWQADARWAYKSAKNFHDDPTREGPDDGIWHHVKRLCDIIQLILFALGLLLTASLTLRLLQ